MYPYQGQLHVRIGESCISFVCSNACVLERLRYLYSDFLSDTPADLSVEIMALKNTKPEINEQPAVNTALHHGGGLFHFSDNLVSGEYDFNSKRVRVLAPGWLLTQDYGSYYLNQIMCLLYNSSLYIKGINKPHSHIIHSSAIIRDGCGLVFTGPSGIGKTTIAKMCANHRNTVVINDEGNLISIPGVKDVPVIVEGIPIIGKLTKKNNLSAPLICILLLKQNSKTTFRLLDRTEAFKRLMFQVVANAYFGRSDMKSILTSKADFCEEIVRHVPCYELEFTLDDKQLSNTLDNLKQLLVSESNKVCLIK